MAQFTLESLRDEIDNDPNSYGYASMENSQIVEALNQVRTSGPGSIDVDVAFREGYELQNEIVASEYNALTDVQRQLWAAILAGGRIEVRNPNIRGQIVTVWGAGTTSRTNLGRLQTRKGSRAEELWDDGFAVTLREVRDAKALP